MISASLISAYLYHLRKKALVNIGFHHKLCHYANALEIPTKKARKKNKLTHFVSSRDKLFPKSELAIINSFMHRDCLCDNWKLSLPRLLTGVYFQGKLQDIGNVSEQENQVSTTHNSRNRWCQIARWTICIMLKNGQTYFKNLAVRTPQVFKYNILLFFQHYAWKG